MRKAKIINLIRLSSLPDQDIGSQPVYKVTTDWNEDKQNSFYMSQVDTTKTFVKIATTPQGDPTNPNMLNWGDEIIFDKQKFLSKTVVWKGRTFKQYGYSFDGR